MSMVRPSYKVNKADDELRAKSFPFVAPIPAHLRRFVCFVIVENSKIAMLGSGTFTTEGIVTAGHLFSFDFEKITVVLHSDYHHITRVPALGVTIEHTQDIAYLLSVAIPKFMKPCLLPSSGIATEKFIAFGCPQGIYGITWHPKVVGFEKGWIITQGLVIPGISGGGLYYRHKGRWYLAGVHSWGYLDNKTLYSSRIV